MFEGVLELIIKSTLYAVVLVYSSIVVDIAVLDQIWIPLDGLGSEPAPATTLPIPTESSSVHRRWNNVIDYA